VYDIASVFLRCIDVHSIPSATQASLLPVCRCDTIYDRSSAKNNLSIPTPTPTKIMSGWTLIDHDASQLLIFALRPIHTERIIRPSTRVDSRLLA